jgi:hypothetical protein
LLEQIYNTLSLSGRICLRDIQQTWNEGFMFGDGLDEVQVSLKHLAILADFQK